jgi:hypothetical protein
MVGGGIEDVWRGNENILDYKGWQASGKKFMTRRGGI